MTSWLARPAVLAGGFLVMSLLVLAGLGWVTHTALAAEEGQRQASAAADRATRERLALWRLDAAALPVVARENARPFADYYTPAAAPPEGVKLLLQLDPAGRWTAPQAAGPSLSLEQLKDVLTPEAAARLFADIPAPPAPDPTPDYRLRMQSLDNLNPVADRPDRDLQRLSAPPPGVHLGPMRAVWALTPEGELLFLVRPVDYGRRRLYQAAWLDWPHLQRSLAAQLTDILPAAGLRPARAAAAERAMTALPVELDPGPLPATAVGWTPLRTGLALAWAATLLALTAVAAGGRAVVQLADRRVRFVSAVTHELRTPLTSLRLYLDLLAGGLVTDPKQQSEYLHTLTGEADRLHRLIENVLDFARLERRAVRANCKPVAVADLLDELAGTWADRLSGEGKDLVVTTTLPKEQRVRTDPRMAVQVLGNLLDNARKYSRGAADGRVWLTAKPAGRGRVAVEVEDRGPGVPAADRAAVFRPFRRGRSTETVGGAGLGLALAGQWARLLGGSLAYREADGGGACFRLELPAA